ncbi:MAG: YesL family protein [Agathobacter sp.]|uniref:YesL family protein n=1 Tax=Agathobacter sp. TaxID=2021311 RepID=UPI0025857F6F|nr:YesL family protein [Agathobacter sp.]MCR5676736.1 YesL family protein [Agathobacter sp.]
MDQIFNADNRFFRGLSKIIDCIVISFCWFVCCVPSITIVFMCVSAANYLLMPLLIPLMVLVGPASSALYYVTVKNIRRSQGYCFREFWNGFRNSFKPAFLAGMVSMGFFLLMLFDTYVVSVYLYDAKIGPVSWIFVVMALFCVMWSINLFAYIARFDDKARVAIKNSLIIGIANLPKSFVQLVIAVAVMVGCYLIWPLTFAAMFIVPAILTLIISMLMEKTFRKYMSEEDIASEDEKNRVY